ncbi:ORC-CDC6 family AAA ATPase [Nocardioides zeicaulis]|uniref:ATP-binding protein n=1 Tax=Nocardioides zeicaulis TaxID=1776857 RepID=A0ABV6E0R1_9ACTN
MGDGLIKSGSNLLEQLNRAFGQVRAEYQSDDELYRQFSAPLYFNQLLGISPSFLVGGRGTGKTTTLRSMSFGGQARVVGSDDPRKWDVVGAYWKVEPNVVTVFRGKGVSEETWSAVFSQYLNLKLSSMVVDYAIAVDAHAQRTNLDDHQLLLFTRSLHMEPSTDLTQLSQALDLALVDVETKINGNISGLATLPVSLPGRPLDYLFKAIGGLAVDRSRPFMFCLDEYETLEIYQKKILNTLIKQVGKAPYTFKIGVRNRLSIVTDTLIDAQPIQDPADFTTVDIISDLKGESFEKFASTVIGQRFDLIGRGEVDPAIILPALTLELEADLLGAGRVRDELLSKMTSDSTVGEAEVEFLRNLSNLQACMVSKWADSHHEPPSIVLRFAMTNPKEWNGRMVNYGYAMLFSLREKRIGERKYYAGWKQYCQLADGNIRYLIRLVYEALRMHALEGGGLDSQVSVQHQTRAAARVGETTIRDLQGWSRHGAALTRLALGLGSIFGTLAREAPLATPEVNQFRVTYARGRVEDADVDQLLNEAVGQGILLSFEGDKNARGSVVTREPDYQLHPVLSPYFVYSSRRKRRMHLRAEQILALTQRESANSTARGILSTRIGGSDAESIQLSLLEQP